MRQLELYGYGRGLTLDMRFVFFCKTFSYSRYSVGVSIVNAYFFSRFVVSSLYAYGCYVSSKIAFLCDCSVRTKYLHYTKLK